MFPINPEISDLYQFYLRNLPNQIVKIYPKKQSKIALSNGQIEQVQRLPWKSKLKAEHYMDLNKFTDEQKEYARNYLENDGFNLKKN